MSTVIDGDFSFAREVDGGPSVTTDEVTYAKIITRRFCQLTGAYVPLAQGSNDPLYSNAYLIAESTDSVQGPLSFFTRTYCTLPPSRHEKRMIAFTRPGQSAYTTSKISGLPIGWNQYGLAAPSSRLVLADVDYSYALNASFSAPAVTNILYQGAVVDYTGSVYINVGQVQVSGGVSPVYETRWQLQGTTRPLSIPSRWVESVNISRWRGLIWQMEVVSVDTAL